MCQLWGSPTLLNEGHRVLVLVASWMATELTEGSIPGRDIAYYLAHHIKITSRGWQGTNMTRRVDKGKKKEARKRRKSKENKEDRQLKGRYINWIQHRNLVCFHDPCTPSCPGVTLLFIPLLSMLSPLSMLRWTVRTWGLICVSSLWPSSPQAWNWFYHILCYKYMWTLDYVSISPWNMCDSWTMSMYHSYLLMPMYGLSQESVL
jgi:hypothetical protein